MLLLNRLPPDLRAFMQPSTCLADFAVTVRNPDPAWLADKFDHLEKPAFSCK